MAMRPVLSSVTLVALILTFLFRWLCQGRATSAHG